MIRYFLLSLLIISSNCTYSTKIQNGIIQEYYNNAFAVSDNDDTYKLLEYITSPDIKKEDISDAINIFCEICKKADGALSEALVDFAIIMIDKYPNQIISKITEDKELQSQYIHFIAAHFYYNHSTVGTSAFDDFFKKIGNELDSQTKINTLSYLKHRVKEFLITISD